MSHPAGTLVTTYNATHVPPRFMPGYKGHVPTMKFDYGETFGNHTAKYFQDYRSKTLESSQSNYCKGGYFPTCYTHQPELVIGNRTRSRDRWLAAPRYTLNNLDFDRKEELIHFDKLAQAHREHYTDKSGTVHQVNHFQIPTKAEEQFQKIEPPLTIISKCTPEICTPEGRLTQGSTVCKLPQIKASKRDRRTRDVYFEKRGALTSTVERGAQTSNC